VVPLRSTTSTKRLAPDGPSWWKATGYDITDTLDATSERLRKLFLELDLFIRYGRFRGTGHLEKIHGLRQPASGKSPETSRAEVQRQGAPGFEI
jgi:hypothetical protein